MAKALLLAGAAAAIFGWWGMYTAGGRRQFDEMAGMIPMASLALGVLLLLIGVGLLLWRR